MDLREYLFRERITCTDLAKKLDIDRIYLGLIKNGKKPGRKLARRILEATDGKVTYEDLGINDLAIKKNINGKKTDVDIL